MGALTVVVGVVVTVVVGVTVGSGGRRGFVVGLAAAGWTGSGTPENFAPNVGTLSPETRGARSSMAAIDSLPELSPSSASPLAISEPRGGGLVAP